MNDRQKAIAEAIDNTDTRPQRRGWAPGEYLNHCRTCEVVFIGDKRAWTCADCAYKEPDAPPPHAPPPKHALIAVHDGAEESACWGLYLEYDGEPAVEIPWPKDWPARIDGEFLRARGFKTITA
jgi:hypothetical protein